MRIRLSAQARRDHEDLNMYTVETWGMEQAEQYD
jgi:plasmid stabilization system protein ParE